MRTRRPFRPALESALEPRLVMSGGMAGEFAALRKAVEPPAKPRVRPTVRGQLAVAFKSFSEDYGAARDTYVGGLADADPDSSAANQRAFTLFVGRRVELLAQKVSGNLLRIQLASASGGDKSDKGRSAIPINTLSTFVTRKLNALNDQGQPMAGTLLRSLTDAIPPAGSSRPTIDLLNDSADTAILAARQSIFNGVTLLKSSRSGDKSRR